MVCIIDKDEERIGGKPALSGTRISAELIFLFVNDNQSSKAIDEIIDNYPHLDRKMVEDVVEVGLIARKCLKDIDPEKMSMLLFGKKLHLDFSFGVSKRMERETANGDTVNLIDVWVRPLLEKAKGAGLVTLDEEVGIERALDQIVEVSKDKDDEINALRDTVSDLQSDDE